jgi:DNA (cytosine-5)-methyltransferase 1
MFKAVDVMSFAGGFTLGMVQAGFKLVGKREMKGGFGVANCEANRHLLGHDWRAEATDPSKWSVVSADVVFGNPPCSGFSAMSHRDFRGAESKINQCMWSFVEYAARVNPQIAVFESVQQAFTRPDGKDLMQRLRRHIEELTGEKWNLYHIKHNAYSVGGAAQRRRYFWLVSRIPFGVEIPRLTRLPSLNDIIEDLANLSDTWSAQPYRAPSSWWADSRRSVSGFVDGHKTLSSPIVGRVRDLMAKVDWQPKEHVQEICRRYYQQEGELPPSWKATEAKLVANDFFQGFTTPVRWSGDEPARVITGGGLITTIHPFENRTITHREAARILGFPDDWRIWPLRRVTGLSATWGKGITVDCGRWVGNSIHRALMDDPAPHTGIEINEREFVIDCTTSWKQVSKPDTVNA